MALPSKKCWKCGKAKKIATSFYANRDWKEELKHDAWCKECVQKFVKNKNNLQEYCAKNNRMFSEELWKWCLSRVQNERQFDVDYNSIEDEIKKQKVFLDYVAKHYFKQMNQVQYYTYIDNPYEAEVIRPKEKDSEEEDDKEEEKFYSSDWRGYYTQEDLDYLNQYYQGLLDDFNIVNKNHHDYAKKVAKASLMMDKAFEDMLNGESGADKRYKDAKEVFDSLSTSAQFAEKTRSINDSAGLGSLGEIVKRIEETGFIQSKVEFSKDDVDLLLTEFKHTFKALRGALE